MERGRGSCREGEGLTIASVVGLENMATLLYKVMKLPFGPRCSMCGYTGGAKNWNKLYSKEGPIHQDKWWWWRTSKPITYTASPLTGASVKLSGRFFSSSSFGVGVDSPLSSSTASAFLASCSPFCSPYVSSVTFCIGTSRSRKRVRKPAAQNPSIARHTVAMLFANATRTSLRSGSGRLLMTGIAAYAISTPAGNWDANADGSCDLSSFWRMEAEMATPHV